MAFVFCCRVARELEERSSRYEPSVGAAPDDSEHPFKLDEHDFVPHFQRVSISGEDTSGVRDRIHCFRQIIVNITVIAIFSNLSHLQLCALTGSSSY